MKFKYKIVATTVGVLLFSLSLLSINQYIKVSSSVDELVTASASEVSTALSNNIVNVLERKNQLARYVMSLIEDDISAENIERVFKKPIIINEFVLTGVGFEDDGRILGNDPGWIPSDDYDSRTRPWYIQAKQANDLIMTEPYPDSVTKEIVVSLGIPMSSQGQFAGAMFFDVSLGGLGKVLNKIKPLNAGYAFLISDQGEFISHPDVALNGKPVSDFFGNKLAINTEFQEFEVNGQDKLIKMVKVPNTNWLVGISLEKQLISQTATTLKNQAIIYSIISLVLGIAVLILVLGRLLQPLYNISNAMADISKGEGDLTQRLSTDCDKEFAVLAEGFNQFVHKLQVLITDSKNLGKQITQGTKDAESGSVESTNAINAQLEELDLLVGAMTEMSSTSLKVSEYAQLAAESVKEVEGAVTNGGSTVTKTSQSIDHLSSHIDEGVAQVKQLEEATVNIETILSVISGIAEQTNLLALNAAIEAARAGEQGRGFAVVADEVRNLAQRTQQSTAEIKSMIEVLQTTAEAVSHVMSSSKDEAVNSVEQAGRANDAILSIDSEIQKITDLTLQIAAAAEEQHAVSDEVNSNATNIKMLSKTVFDNAQQTSDVMSNQNQITVRQYKVLSRFTI